MQDNNFEVSVSTEVLEKMAEIAACEIKGVKGLSKKSIDIKGAIKNMNAFKGVKVEMLNGTAVINIYIVLEKEAKMREVAVAVQENIKDKIQTMTGTAVTKVNVTVADIAEEPKNE
ncbi:MAG: Asp23/Gls24 family envelope stress response protein [Clostridia bacterium]|nr:Asp23/Gls24 family envelope stress response protein [Clostridia bacterium]